MEISNTMRRFLTYVRVEKGLCREHGIAYRRDLLKFESYSKKKKLTLESVTPRRSGGFPLQPLSAEARKPDSCAHLVTLRNFFRFAQTQDLISVDPALNLESPKIRRSLPGYLRWKRSSAC